MSETVSKIDAAAERAYAEAAAQKTESAKAEAGKAEAAPVTAKAPAVPAATTASVKTVPTKAVPAKKTAAKKKPAAKKPLAKKASLKKTAPKTTRKSTKRAAPAKRFAKKDNSTMATKNTKKTTEKNTEAKIKDMASNVAADVQDRAKAAYSKAGEVAGEMGEFTKGNVEAFVESGKILAGGMQDMARETVEDAKSVFEQTTEDLRLFAAVKSPTELLKLQSEIARRNFDVAVKYGSKRTEANIKLANEAFAPIQNRISVAGEKIRKVA